MKKYWNKDGKAIYILNQDEMTSISEKLVPESRIYQSIFDLLVKHKEVEQLNNDMS